MARKGEEITVKQALERLREIVSQVENKKIDLDKSLDLLEEGVRLANLCTEKTNQDSWEEDEVQLGDADS